jgi:hypothetical protein
LRGETGLHRHGPGPTSFGDPIALSADGKTALIGGGGGTWVFTRSGSTWTQRDKLKLGVLGLSADGRSALVISVQGGSSQGALEWAVARSPSRWTIEPGPALPASARRSGALVGALSGDGRTALLGLGTGATWAFTRSGSTWTQLGTKLVGRGQTSLGNIALSANGRTAVILGGEAGTAGLADAWVFAR